MVTGNLYAFSPSQTIIFYDKAFTKICLNSAKQAKMNNNDFNCSSNIEKLFKECERLSEVAKKKTAIINHRKMEYEQFLVEKKKLDDAKSGAGSLGGDKDMADEIKYLKI